MLSLDEEIAIQSGLESKAVHVFETIFSQDDDADLHVCSMPRHSSAATTYRSVNMRLRYSASRGKGTRSVRTLQLRPLNG